MECGNPPPPPRWITSRKRRMLPLVQLLFLWCCHHHIGPTILPIGNAFTTAPSLPRRIPGLAPPLRLQPSSLSLSSRTRTGKCRQSKIVVNQTRSSTYRFGQLLLQAIMNGNTEDENQKVALVESSHKENRQSRPFEQQLFTAGNLASGVSTTTTPDNEALDKILLDKTEASSTWLDHLNGNDDDKSRNISQQQPQQLKKTTLRKAIEYIQARPNLQLSRQNWKLLFDGIESATALESAQIAMAAQTKMAQQQQQRSSSITFPTNSPARSDMTELYELLKHRGDLRIFGAAASGRLPALGETTVSKQLWRKVTGMPVTALTPSASSSTQPVLLAGVILAIMEAIIAILFGIPPNAMLVITVLVVLMDRLLLNGGTLESLVQKIAPSTVSTIIRHEAGHFLIAYLLGCPVEGVVLSAWAALKDARFAKPTTAGTSFFDPELSRQLNNNLLITTNYGDDDTDSMITTRTITRSAVDRYSITVMAGIAAEANCFQQANGGAADEQALVQLLSTMQGGTKSFAFSFSAIQNQARWGALQALLLLRQYSAAYQALVDTLESGNASLAECVLAIERAAREHELPSLAEPVGYIVRQPNRDGVIVGYNTYQWMTPDEMKAKQVEESKQENLVPAVLTDDEMLRILSQRREEAERQLRDIEMKLKQSEEAAKNKL